MLFAVLIIGSWLMTTFGIFIFLILSNSERPAGYHGESSATLSTWALIANIVTRMVRDAPAFLVPFYFCYPDQHLTEYGRFLTCLLLFHYAYRSFVYPLFVTSKQQWSMKNLLIAFMFCCWNGFIQGAWNAYHQPEIEKFHPRFLVNLGIGLFVESRDVYFVLTVLSFQVGFAIHLTSVFHLITFRSRNGSAPQVPRGLLFEFISCPNYLGECLQWIGYAMAARSFPAIAFASFTVCNLAPRAMSHHKRYRETLGSKYPANRKALIPIIW